MPYTDPNAPTEPVYTEHPNPASAEPYITNTGLTKREYFSIKALQGLLAGGDKDSKKRVAARAVSFADTLVDELNNH